MTKLTNFQIRKMEMAVSFCTLLNGHLLEGKVVMFERDARVTTPFAIDPEARLITFGTTKNVREDFDPDDCNTLIDVKRYWTEMFQVFQPMTWPA